MPSTRTGRPSSRTTIIPAVRIVHVTPELPAAAGWTGGATRQFQLLRRLAAHGHEIVVAAPVQDEQVRSVAELAAAAVRVVASRRPQSRVRESLAAVVREPSL